MHPAKKRNTRKRILVAIPLVILVLVLIAYLFIIYQFEEVLKVVVYKESNGTYQLTASRVDFAIWKNRVILRNPVIEPVDTANQRPHYNIRAKRIHLSVESIIDAVFTKKMAVNDLSIDGLVVNGHTHTQEEAKKPVSLHASEVMDIISNVSEKLQVKRFSLSDATVNYSSSLSAEPFSADRINLTVVNFRKKDSVQHDLLYTDDIDLSITNQSWRLSNGRQDVQFNRLHYSARDQFIQLDTCTISVKGKQGGDSVSLYADKLRFTPRKLQEHLNQDELVIDSLICTRPLLILQKGEEKIKDSTGTIAGAMHTIFETVQLKYIDISQGAFQVFERSASAPTYATELADIKIFNLQAPRGNFRGLSIDSIQWRLNNLSFLTKDSLYQLTVSEFSMKQNDLVFVNAVFGNAPGNLNPFTLNFMTPAIRFRNIDFEELMRKRLKAPSIEIAEPVISLYAKSNKRNRSDSVGKFSTADFYKVLHGLEELINVDSFRIVNGQLRLRSPGNTIRADLKRINGVVMVNRLLKSDSLVDIKRSIPLMNIDSIEAAIPSLWFAGAGLVFKGNKKDNQLGSFSLRIPNTGVFTGRRIEWDMFDWDVLQDANTLKVDRLAIGELSVKLWPAGGVAAAAGFTSVTEVTDIARVDSNARIAGVAKVYRLPAKKTPKIAIGKLNIGSMDLSLEKQKTTVQFTAKAFAVDDIRSINKNIGWNRLRSGIEKLVFRSGSNELTVKNIQLDNKRISILKDARFASIDKQKSIRYHAPEISLGLHPANSDFSKIHISSFLSPASELSVEILDSSRIQSVTKNSKSIPVFVLDTLDLKDIAVSYKNLPKKLDTRSAVDLTGDHIRTIASLAPEGSSESTHMPLSNTVYTSSTTGSSIQREASDAIGYRNLTASLKQIVFQQPGTLVQSRQASLGLRNGKLSLDQAGSWLLHSKLKLQVDGVDLEIRKAGKNLQDTSTIDATGISGKLALEEFRIGSQLKPDMLKLAMLANLNGSAAKFVNRSVNAGIDSFAWAGSERRFETGKFYYSAEPGSKISANEKTWQKDEMTVKGESISVSGFSYIKDDNRLNKSDASNTSDLSNTSNVSNIPNVFNVPVRLKNSNIASASRNKGLSATNISVTGLLLETSRDKTLPFKHGIEKLMPTALLTSLKLPIFIDTLHLLNGTVIVQEKSAQTKNTGVIPIENINGSVTNLTNYMEADRPLVLRGSANVLGNRIEQLEYRETYNDSLSNFDLRFNASPMRLPAFSKATVPLANVKVTGGNADTVYAHWSGNKYAAIGRMNFHYHDLKVAMLNKTDPAKFPFRIRMMNALINGMLRNRNKKETLVFFMRDREKFIFNYWVKTTVSGVVTSVGVKRSKKYLRQYHKVKDQYSLPPLPGKTLPPDFENVTSRIP